MGRYRCNKGDIPEEKIWKPIGRITSMEHFARQKNCKWAISIPLPAIPGRWHLLPQSDSICRRVRESGTEDWAKHPAKDRGKILQNAARLLRESNERLAKIETMDTGKPISESSSVDILSAAECLEYFGGIAAGLSGRQIDLGRSFAYTRLEPLGICAGIGAWNYPIQIAAWKAARIGAAMR